MTKIEKHATVVLEKGFLKHINFGETNADTQTAVYDVCEYDFNLNSYSLKSIKDVAGSRVKDKSYVVNGITKSIHNIDHIINLFDTHSIENINLYGNDKSGNELFNVIDRQTLKQLIEESKSLFPNRGRLDNAVTSWRDLEFKGEALQIDKSPLKEMVNKLVQTLTLGKVKELF